MRRRISAILCLVGAVLIAWGLLINAWWSARLTTPDRIVDLKIGLVSLTSCTHDANDVWRCESADWKDFTVPIDTGLWVWSGRLLYGVGLATAISLAIAALLAGVPIAASLPVSPARMAIGFGVAALGLVGLYRVSTPDAIKLLLDAGCGWALTLVGLVAGGIGAVRELDPRDD